jgi:hypothetical protein
MIDEKILMQAGLAYVLSSCNNPIPPNGYNIPAMSAAIEAADEARGFKVEYRRGGEPNNETRCRRMVSAWGPEEEI